MFSSLRPELLLPLVHLRILTSHPLSVLQIPAGTLNLGLLYALLHLGGHTHAHVLSVSSVGRSGVAQSTIREVSAGPSVRQIGDERCLTQRLHGNGIATAFGMRLLRPEACPVEDVGGREVNEFVEDLLLCQPGQERMLLVA